MKFTCINYAGGGKRWIGWEVQKELQLFALSLSALFNSLSFLFFIIVGFTLCKSIGIYPLWEKFWHVFFPEFHFEEQLKPKQTDCISFLQKF